MSFNYKEVNLDALAAQPVSCTCADKPKWEILKDVILDKMWSGEIETVHLGKMRWRLEPIGDHAQVRKDAEEKIKKIPEGKP